MIDLANLTIESRDKILAIQNGKTLDFSYLEIRGRIKKENLYYVFYNGPFLICALRGFELDMIVECMDRYRIGENFH